VAVDTDAERTSDVRQASRTGFPSVEWVGQGPPYAALAFFGWRSTSQAEIPIDKT